MENVCLIVFTDGRRGYLERTLASFDENLAGSFRFQILSDDSADPAFAAALDAKWGHRFHIIDHHPERLGFCASIARTWELIPSDNYYVFHLEDDFLLLRPVRLEDMSLVFFQNPRLMEITFLRQPSGRIETEAGGIWQCQPAEYLERHLITPDGRDIAWLEHSLPLWNTNPSLYPRSLTLNGFPEPPFCERQFGLRGRDLGWRLAYWGTKHDAPLVEHIGIERKGTGY